MGFYYAREKQKFDAEWERLSAWYQAEGMSAEAIRELYQYDWIESLDDGELAGRLKKLSEDDRELLTQIVMDGLTKAEVARLRGVTRQSINDKIQRIKKFLKKV